MTEPESQLEMRPDSKQRSDLWLWRKRCLPIKEFNKLMLGKDEPMFDLSKGK